MEKQLLKNYGGGCARNLAFQIISVVLVFSLFLIPALIAALWGGDHQTNFAILAGVLVGLLLLGVAAIIIWRVNRINKRNAQLDEIFSHWGLAGSNDLRGERQYQGEIFRRPAKINFQRGPSLEITLQAPLKTRGAVIFKSETGKLAASLKTYEQVALHDPLFHNLSLFAADANWMNKILADDPARKAIRELMRVTGAYELRQILILPDALQLTIRRITMDEINRENIHTWLEALHTLLTAIKAAPSPQALTVAIPIRPLQTHDRKSRLILGAAVGVSLLIPLLICGGAITALIFVQQLLQ